MTGCTSTITFIDETSPIDGFEFNKLSSTGRYIQNYPVMEEVKKNTFTIQSKIIQIMQDHIK